MTNANSFEHTSNVHHHDRLLTRRMLRLMVPVSDMTIWRWEKGGTFPEHLSIYGRNYWRLSEVQNWMDRQRRPGASAKQGNSNEA
jgi:predicted DNA-binding transcriptional regulator AlpA